WLEKQAVASSLIAIGHRIVHGMKHANPEPISDELLEELTANIAFDPEHLPGEIGLIKQFGDAYPGVLQIACFDTAFHTSMPQVAKRLAIPRHYQAKGIQRYGFHGLSYAYLLEELERIAGTKAARGKIIMAHLGSGASLAAVKDGKSRDTSMGFTPASGLPMSTRSGDLDPGVASYLMQAEKFTPQAFNEFINHQSGLFGLSETSGDMQELLKAEATDVSAAEAVDFFCYQTKKWIGAYAAVLGGLDTLLFSGGIGEHADKVRSKICDNLKFLGIELDEIKNRNNESIISSDESKVTVYVIKTNEELMIAREVLKLLDHMELNSKT
ncbi:MAG: acetate/propionate family kinase, partial [Chitinophagaceae bacterium]